MTILNTRYNKRIHVTDISIIHSYKTTINHVIHLKYTCIYNNNKKNIYATTFK